MHQYEDKPHLGGTWAGGDPNAWSPAAWDRIIADKKIENVIDIGCGEGYSSKYFQDKGMVVLCIEGGGKAVDVCRTKKLPVIQHDYTEGIYKPETTFDLGWCCEFVEHVTEAHMNNFLETFKHCKYLAMTHAFPGQPGHHHVNCQLPEYWIPKIEALGFRLDLPYTLVLRELASDALHINRSLLFFEKISITTE